MHAIGFFNDIVNYNMEKMSLFGDHINFSSGPQESVLKVE